MANFLIIISSSVMCIAGIIRAYRQGNFFLSCVGAALLIALHLSIFAGGGA